MFLPRKESFDNFENLYNNHNLFRCILVSSRNVCNKKYLKEHNMCPSTSAPLMSLW